MVLNNMSGKKDYHVIGIRPGEKLHEVMCPIDDSYHTYEYHDHYVITPSIKFYGDEVNFEHNKLGETGALVDTGFEFHSGTNQHFLSVDEIKQFNDD